MNPGPNILETDARTTDPARFEADPSVEGSADRVHCSIVRQGDQWILRMEGRAGRVVVDGQPASQAVLRPGDAVELGGVHYRIGESIEPGTWHAIRAAWIAERREWANRLGRERSVLAAELRQLLTERDEDDARRRESWRLLRRVSRDLARRQSALLRREGRIDDLERRLRAREDRRREEEASLARARQALEQRRSAIDREVAEVLEKARRERADASAMLESAREACGEAERRARMAKGEVEIHRAELAGLTRRVDAKRAQWHRWKDLPPPERESGSSEPTPELEDAANRRERELAIREARLDARETEIRRREALLEEMVDLLERESAAEPPTCSHESSDATSSAPAETKTASDAALAEERQRLTEARRLHQALERELRERQVQLENEFAVRSQELESEWANWRSEREAERERFTAATRELERDRRALTVEISEAAWREGLLARREELLARRFFALDPAGNEDPLADPPLPSIDPEVRQRLDSVESHLAHAARHAREAHRLRNRLDEAELRSVRLETALVDHRRQVGRLSRSLAASERARVQLEDRLESLSAALAGAPL